ncbi:hypothetical protein GCM10023195_86630 [Actinoallomurus liliacearum]|uniref:MmyB-like transcription regulator ligand binding domain-containing protein n=1 Tax=Actinoallomurus liliacearum TaxID=1080073 RepID=A0ABP8TY15_9ACTN
MNDAETQHLFDLARAASEGTRTRRAKPRPARLPQRAAQLIDTMSDVATVALGPLGDVLAANTLGRALFPHLFPDNGRPLNHTRYLFLDDRARDYYADWEHDARHVVSALRLIAGHDPSNPALMALIGELATHSPEFRTWWAGHTVTVHAAGTKAIRHPVVGARRSCGRRAGPPPRARPTAAGTRRSKQPEATFAQIDAHLRQIGSPRGGSARRRRRSDPWRSRRGPTAGTPCVIRPTA